MCSTSHQTIRARTSRYTTTIWKPNTVCWVSSRHPGEVGGSGWLWFETMACTAPTTVAVASVAMKELMPSTTTRKPFKAPTATPTSTAIRMDVHMP